MAKGKAQKKPQEFRFPLGETSATRVAGAGWMFSGSTDLSEKFTEFLLQLSGPYQDDEQKEQQAETASELTRLAYNSKVKNNFEVELIIRKV